MLLIDTNVLVDVLEKTIPRGLTGRWLSCAPSQKIHRLAINPIIYSELSLTFSTMEALDQTIDDLDLVLVEMSRPALFSRRKGICSLPPPRWQQEQCPRRFLYWGACDCIAVSPADSGHASLHVLFFRCDLDFT